MKYILGFFLGVGAVVGTYTYLASADVVTEVPARFTEAILHPLNQEVGMDKLLVIKSTEVVSDSVVRTNESGRALIKSGPQILTSVAENSSLTFSQNEQSSTAELYGGKVWSRLERALEQDEVYEVYTPTMVAAVRGTSFGTYVENEAEKIIVGEGVVGVRKRDEESGVSVAAGTVAEIIDDNIFVRPISEAEKDVWYAEHMDPDWSYGGANNFELITAHREGFWLRNPGQITVIGTGFNQLRKVELDGELIPFVPVSDTEVRVPWTTLLKVREDSDVIIHLDDRTVLPGEVFFGDREEVFNNLIF